MKGSFLVVQGYAATGAGFLALHTATSRLTLASGGTTTNPFPVFVCAFVWL
jgi:hypothetical protein